MSATATRQGIGGSDAAAACGLDPFRSRVQLWLEKTGRAPERDETEAMRWGTLLQPILLTELQDRAPYGIIKWSEHRADDLPPWLSGTPDALSLGPEEPYGIVEAKTTNAYNAKAWADDAIPTAYVLQAQHYLALTGLGYALVCCLIGGQSFVWRRLERDDKLIGTMLELEADFWRHVETDTPPAPDGSASADAMIAHLYPDAAEGIMRLTADDMEAVKRLRTLKRAGKVTERQIAEAEQTLKLRLGDAPVGTYEGRVVLRWPSVSTRRLNQKAFREAEPAMFARFCEESTYRRFTVA